MTDFKSEFDPLINVIDKLEVYVGRPSVQIQLGVVIAVVLFAFVASKLFWVWAMPRALGLVQLITRRRIRRAVFLAVNLACACSFPILTLSLVEPARNFLVGHSIPGGLIVKFNWVLLTLLCFRIFDTLLQRFLNAQVANRFRGRLLNPLFWGIIIVVFLDNVTDLGMVHDIRIITAFGTELKLGPVCIATFGLYFFAGILSLLDEIVFQFISKHTRMDPGRSKANLTLARYILLIAGVLPAFGQFELDPAIIAAISGGLSIGVGFGLREILSNFISGFLLLFERSLNPGDVIEMDDQLSVVEKLSVRATTVRTLNNEELVIPNQTFLTASFKTYTGTDRTVRQPILIQTDCAIDPNFVCTLLASTSSLHEKVLPKPLPSVFIVDYANNVATFQLNIWLANPLDSPIVVSEVKLLIWEAFQENKIALPFPEMDLHFPKTVPLAMANSRGGAVEAG